MKARQVKLILCWWRFSAFCDLWILTLKQSEDSGRVALIGQIDSQFKLTWTGHILLSQHCSYWPMQIFRKLYAFLQRIFQSLGFKHLAQVQFCSCIRSSSECPPIFRSLIILFEPPAHDPTCTTVGNTARLCFSNRGCDVNITIQHRYQSCHTAVSTFVSRFVKASAVGKGKRKSNGVFECCHGDPWDALHISVKELLSFFSQKPWRFQLAWCRTPVCLLIGLFFSCGLLRIGTQARATCAPFSCLIGSVVSLLLK